MNCKVLTVGSTDEGKAGDDPEESHGDEGEKIKKFSMDSSLLS